jgi:hypothetical protein
MRLERKAQNGPGRIERRPVRRIALVTRLERPWTQSVVIRHHALDVSAAAAARAMIAELPRRQPR